MLQDFLREFHQGYLQDFPEEFLERFVKRFAMDYLVEILLSPEIPSQDFPGLIKSFIKAFIHGFLEKFFQCFSIRGFSMNLFKVSFLISTRFSTGFSVMCVGIFPLIYLEIPPIITPAILSEFFPGIVPDGTR